MKLFGNPSSLHSEGQKANEALTNARERIARLLGCEPREITFTSGGSEADNQAILSAARLGERKGIPLTTLIEGGAQERGKRAGTENIPAIVGMAAALEEACLKIDESTAKLTSRTDRQRCFIVVILFSVEERFPNSILELPTELRYN